MSQILLLNTEQTTLRILTNLLKTEGYKVSATSEVSKAMAMLSKEKFDLMISGTTEGSDAELDVMKKGQGMNNCMQLIVIMKSNTGATAEKIALLKPYACIETPLRVDKLMQTVQLAVDYKGAPLSESVNLNMQLETSYQYEGLVAESPSMKAVCEMVSRIAATDITVLIQGEPGVGKTTIAKAIHAGSKRKDKPFVTVDCLMPDAEAVLKGQGSSSLLEADKGSVFLKEVDGLVPSAQQALMSLLRDRKLAGKPLDVRILASAGRSLEDLVKAGSFNADLAKILKIVPIRVPPLRDRASDIMPTVRLVLREIVGRDGSLPAVDQDVVKVLEAHQWPGNVPAVHDVLSKAVKASGDGKRITKQCLPAGF